MPNHIAIGVVDHNDVITLLLDGLNDAIGHFRRAHFRLQVIGRHLGRRNQNAFLARKRLFTATGKEKGDMGVLFRFRNAQLGLALLGQILAEHIVQGCRWEGAGSRNVGRVLGQHDKTGQLRLTLTVKTGKGRLDKGAAELTGTVGAEVHENHRVAVGNPDRLANHGSLDELVALTALIGSQQAFHRGGTGKLALAINNQVIGSGNPLPTVIPVHRIIASDQAGGAALAQALPGRIKQLQRGLGTFRWRVPAIKEGVQVDLFCPLTHRQFGHGDQMILVAVDTTR